MGSDTNFDVGSQKFDTMLGFLYDLEGFLNEVYS